MIVASPTPTTHDYAYDVLRERVQARVATQTHPLFTTDVPDDLYAVFLAALPESERQHHTCHACRRFVNTFGGLVSIDPSGDTQSALWNVEDTITVAYRAAVAALLAVIKRARVTGVFYSSAPQWGTPITGQWQHLAAQPSVQQVFTRRTQTASQAMAEKHEDYGTLLRVLADFSEPMLTTAVALLKTDDLYRSEKVYDVAEWLRGLHTQRASVRGMRRDNLTWLAVATAPAGSTAIRAVRWLARC